MAISAVAVDGVTVTECKSFGITTGSHSIISNSIINNIDGVGITSGPGSTIRSSSFSENKIGLHFSLYAYVFDSIFVLNDVAIAATSSNISFRGGYRGNVFTHNGGSQEVQPITGLTNMGGNSCGTDTLCP